MANGPLYCTDLGHSTNGGERQITVPQTTRPNNTTGGKLSWAPFWPLCKGVRGGAKPSRLISTNKRKPPTIIKILDTSSKLLVIQHVNEQSRFSCRKSDTSNFAYCKTTAGCLEPTEKRQF